MINPLKCLILSAWKEKRWYPPRNLAPKDSLIPNISTSIVLSIWSIWFKVTTLFLEIRTRAGCCFWFCRDWRRKCKHHRIKDHPDHYQCSCSLLSRSKICSMPLIQDSRLKIYFFRNPTFCQPHRSQDNWILYFYLLCLNLLDIILGVLVLAIIAIEGIAEGHKHLVL